MERRRSSDAVLEIISRIRNREKKNIRVSFLARRKRIVKSKGIDTKWCNVK